MMVFASLLLAAATVQPVEQSDKMSKYEKLARSITPEIAAAQSTLKDDNLEVVAVISTEKVFFEKPKFLTKEYYDNFVRALIDKKTGATTFQVYERIYYSEKNWRFYDTVNYSNGNGGAESTSLTKISSEVVGCYGGNKCTYAETFGFEIPPNMLEPMAVRYAEQGPTVWPFKFKSQSGYEFQHVVLLSEILGAIQAANKYKREHGLP